MVVDVIGGEEMLFSQSYACPEHGISVEELTPECFRSIIRSVPARTVQVSAYSGNRPETGRPES